VDGTANLVNAALKCGVRRFLHVSSISTLGKNKEESAITEDSVCIPSKKNSSYGESKFFSEMEVWRGMAEGLEVVVVNPSVIIGPGNWEKGSCKFFSLVYRGLRFYTTGVTGYVDVRDVVRAIMILTDNKNFDNSKNQKFLLSTQNIEFRAFFGMVADALHKPGPKIKVSGLFLKMVRPIVALVSLLTGIGNIVTKDTISSATGKKYYDGSKITKLFGFEYKPVIQAVHHTAAIYLKDRSIHQA
jgi:nucleoside-diphosphate-sugar epimerase